MTIKRTLSIIAGIFLLILGFIGLFLPGLQGILLIFAGILLISPTHGKKIIAKIKETFKKFRRKK